jgi:hypothetical protein
MACNYRKSESIEVLEVATMSQEIRLRCRPISCAVGYSVLALGWILAAADLAYADFQFSVAENLGPNVNSADFETTAGISVDGLSLYSVRNRVELWLSTRASEQDPWDAALYLGSLMPDEISTTAASIGFLAGVTPADGLEAYYAAVLPGGFGNDDVWVMSRQSTADAWGPLVNLGPPVNTQYNEHFACVSPDGLELYFGGYTGEHARPGGYGVSDLWVSRRASREDSWTEPINLGSTINSAYTDARPTMSPDGLLLFFDSSRPGGFGSLDLYVTTRATLSHPWREPVNLGPHVNTPAIEESARISADGRTLYWDSPRPGGNGDNDLWQAAVTPIVDFNGDGAVDCLDICELVDHWDTDNSLYDIGPTPFGDGVVDAKDLLVLAEHMAESDVNDL